MLSNSISPECPAIKKIVLADESLDINLTKFGYLDPTGLEANRIVVAATEGEAH
jgi:hypothetical protein